MAKQQVFRLRSYRNRKRQTISVVFRSKETLLLSSLKNMCSNKVKKSSEAEMSDKVELMMPMPVDIQGCLSPVRTYRLRSCNFISDD